MDLADDEYDGDRSHRLSMDSINLIQLTKALSTINPFGESIRKTTDNSIIGRSSIHESIQLYIISSDPKIENYYLPLSLREILLYVLEESDHYDSMQHPARNDFSDLSNHSTNNPDNFSNEETNFNSEVNVEEDVAKFNAQRISRRSS